MNGNEEFRKSADEIRKRCERKAILTNIEFEILLAITRKHARDERMNETQTLFLLEEILDGYCTGEKDLGELFRTANETFLHTGNE